MTGTFTDDGLARLETLLASAAYAERALRPDALQGMIHALAIGPDDFPPNAQWIAIALGDDPHTPRTHDPELVDLLTRFAAKTRDEITAGIAQPLLYALRRGRLDYRSWCHGFLIGVNAAESDWFSYGEPEDFDELLGPIELIADALPADARARFTPEQWRKRLLEAEADLPATLERLRSFWAIIREPPATIRRDTAKTGRNNPCPCGSGKKFKHCHGRS